MISGNSILANRVSKSKHTIWRSVEDSTTNKLLSIKEKKLKIPLACHETWGCTLRGSLSIETEGRESRNRTDPLQMKKKKNSESSERSEL